MSMRQRMASLRRQRVSQIRGLALNGGTLLVAVGVGCFDYRFGIIAFGGTIAAAALYGMSKDARHTSRP